MEIPFRIRYTTRMEDESVAELIRRNRELAGLTQKELGEAIGLTDRSISEWERGRRKPGQEAAYGLARVFRIDPGELLRRILHPEVSIVEDALAEDRQGQVPSGDPRFDEAHRIAVALLSRPRAYERWIAYGQGLLDSD